jgi:hypothetical protein
LGREGSRAGEVRSGTWAGWGGGPVGPEVELGCPARGPVAARSTGWAGEQPGGPVANRLPFLLFFFFLLYFLFFLFL